ncbi:insulinase family protein [Candidatus Dependentiae bacterium]|nr:insulinase family protein [Candidatus Dependentiae bacterium]
MSYAKQKTQKVFRVYKKKLSNGMNILVRPSRTIPEVAVQLWYNVGSKDEQEGERGMAHLIEHMIFKGTKKLSESDIDLITIKLGGYANAFTSSDYTAYVFKLPSNVWSEALQVLSDCMCCARFDPQMLNSELHAVIQELKLYKDNYEEALIEKMSAGIFSPHPYHHPIIGYKHDLLGLDRDSLYAFYKKHYHPANATLVVTGDVKREEVFAYAEKYFGKIPSPSGYEKKKNNFVDDIFNVTVNLPREVDNPWAFYTYPVPGFSSGDTYLINMIEFLLAKGRSSRLYEKLVNETKIATTVGCFTLEMFEKSLLIFYVQPINIESLPRIEALIEEEFKAVTQESIEEWEFLSIKKKAEIGYYSLLENVERQAELIGGSFLATGKVTYIDSYMGAVKKVRRNDIAKGVATYLKPFRQHKGYLLPANDEEKFRWMELQKKSDALDKEILKRCKRTTPIEPGRFVIKVKDKPLPEFRYPIPKAFVLDNGLEVLFYHRPATPKLSLLLSFKADYLHEPTELGGMSRFVSQLLREGTKRSSAKELNRYLEAHGIILSTASGFVGLDLLNQDLDKGLTILREILMEPAFAPDSIEKIRQQMLMELQEYWDSPMAFVGTLAREIVYKGHPYSKNRFGYKECVSTFSRDQIVDFYNEYLTPQEALFVMVGDLSGYDENKLRRLLEKHLGSWKGKQVDDLFFPEITYSEPKMVHHEINRDQVVLALAAPSVSRVDNNYDAMSILDFVFTGSGLSMSSRLFQLREQTGLFYTIGGSLVHGAGRAPGMMFIKTMVSVDKVGVAQNLIKKSMKNLRENGISHEELFVASKALMTASTRIFESNSHIAKTYLFLKRCGINLDLFDKRSAILSILKVGAINSTARRYCRENILSTIRVGRSTG